MERSFMLAKRIIPCLDVDDGRVKKGVNFVNLVDVGSPVDIAASYEQQQADELVFLDITATVDARTTMRDVVQEISTQVFMPLTVGGGIKSVDDMTALLKAGADKVSLNSAALANPELITEGAQKFGNQCMVVAIDVKTDEETGEKEMYVPMVVGIKDGKVVGSHTALVDSFEIKDETSQMSDKQKKELQDIYTDIILKVADE